MAEKSTASVDHEIERQLQPRSVSRDEIEVASRLVDRFSIWSGVAGLVPVPVVDLVAVGGLQLQMLRRLSQIYDVPFSDNRGKALIAALAGAMVPTTSGIGAFSVLKAVPIVGTIIGGFVTPVLSAGATYAIGKAFIQHFESGGTLLDFNPPDYREFVKAHKEMWDSRLQALRRSPLARRRPVLRTSAGRMPANRGIAAPGEARKQLSDETGPHARGDRLHNFLRPHRTLRRPSAHAVFVGTFFIALITTPLVVLPVLFLTGPSRRVEWRPRD